MGEIAFPLYDKLDIKAAVLLVLKDVFAVRLVEHSWCTLDKCTVNFLNTKYLVCSNKEEKGVSQSKIVVLLNNVHLSRAALIFNLIWKK